MKIVEQKQSPTLVIPKEISNQINYLCQQVPDLEWSGIMFYTSVGEIDKADKMVMKVTNILLMDIGSAGHTEYEFTEDVATYMMEKNLIGSTIGHIHSHNTMGVFFSGEDDNELRTNSKHHNLYLSLIVNNRGDRLAKVVCQYQAEPISRDIKYKGKNSKGKEVYIIEKAEFIPEAIMLSYKVKVKEDNQILVSQEFVDRLGVIKAKKMKEDAEKKAKLPILYGGGQSKLYDPHTIPANTTNLEPFVRHILNRGSNMGYESIEKLLNRIQKTYGKKSDAYAIDVTQLYVSNYMEFFKLLKEEDIVERSFLDKLTLVINFLTGYSNRYPVLISVLTRLRQIQNQFKIIPNGANTGTNSRTNDLDDDSWGRWE